MSTASLPGWLFALVACGATAQDASRRASQDTPQETRPVTAAATVLANAKDSFEYKVGNPHFHGRTVVRVTGDGHAEASFERGGEVQRSQGTAPAAMLGALRDSLTKHPIDKYQPTKRRPVPDEATMEFILVTDGVRTEASYLDNSRNEIDALAALVAVIQEIASHVSSGKITY